MTLTPQWRKSSRSSANGNCVEVRKVGGQVEVRDSKNPDGGTLAVPPDAWSAFLADVRAGITLA